MITTNHCVAWRRAAEDEVPAGSEDGITDFKHATLQAPY